MALAAQGIEGNYPQRPISRPLKNYLRWQYCVKNGLKRLNYST